MWQIIPHFSSSMQLILNSCYILYMEKCTMQVLLQLHLFIVFTDMCFLRSLICEWPKFYLTNFEQYPITVLSPVTLQKKGQYNATDELSRWEQKNISTGNGIRKQSMMFLLYLWIASIIVVFFSFLWNSLGTKWLKGNVPKWNSVMFLCAQIH